MTRGRWAAVVMLTIVATELTGQVSKQSRVPGVIEYRQSQTSEPRTVRFDNCTHIQSLQVAVSGFLNESPIEVVLDPRTIRRVDFLSRDHHYKGTGWTGTRNRGKDRGVVKVTKWNGQTFELDQAFLMDKRNTKDDTLWWFRLEVRNPVNETIDELLLKDLEGGPDIYPNYIEFTRP